MHKLDDFDIQFIKDKYPLTDWALQDIADELDHPPNTIFYAAQRLGLERPERFKGPGKDWESIWIEYKKNGLAKHQVAEKLDIQAQTVGKAIKRMEEMTEADRIMRWNRYRTKRGLPLFTKC